MKSNLVVNIIMILSIVFLSAGFFVASSHSNTKNIDFLKLYNWDVNPKPIEKVDILIPDVFDEVYNNYNELQIEAGLNLLPYRGYQAVRYTYHVTNFPEETDGEVRANVICVDGEPVGGDICTVALDGFMYSLNFNVQNCFSYDKMKSYF